MPERLELLAALSKWNEFITPNTTTLTTYLYKSYILKQGIYTMYECDTKYNLFRISKQYYILITFINMQYAMFRWAAPDAVLCTVVRDSKLHNKTEIACWISNNNVYNERELCTFIIHEWDFSFYECVSSDAAYVRRMHLFKYFHLNLGALNFYHLRATLKLIYCYKVF